ncbi:hypothetical protein SLI_7968 [Streptomyces lividans 1326]|uniref:Uncharacterized protein n=1 Tax=Streptomyces lividans 1326 TaxID=1200984 RepID=A0A7U9DYU2_STRLI|nr:hypothetical protein SLI_7968 [Streptomyces lividans 1326]
MRGRPGPAAARPHCCRAARRTPGNAGTGPPGVCGRPRCVRLSVRRGPSPMPGCWLHAHRGPVRRRPGSVRPPHAGGPARPGQAVRHRRRRRRAVRRRRRTKAAAGPSSAALLYRTP